MQLWKHPNGTYYVLHGPRLKRRISTGTRDRRKAERYLSQFIAGSENKIPENRTVGSILEGYEADHGPSLRSPEALKYSIRALQPFFGDLLPSHLLPMTIKRYARERGASDGTILREIGVLRAALSWAVENKWIEAKPIISNPVKRPPPRDRWITKQEAEALLDACREPHIRLFVLMGLMTAARMSAILEAKWSQVDWELRRIDYGKGHGNKRRAIVPLNDTVFDTLNGARKLACSDYIIEYGGQPIKTVKKGFQSACKRAGLKGVTPHILRHSGATWMSMDGVPMREIAQMLGDSEATVERVYAKYHPDYLKRAASALQLAS